MAMGWGPGAKGARLNTVIITVQFMRHDFVGADTSDKTAVAHAIKCVEEHSLTPKGFEVAMSITGFVLDNGKEK